MANVQDKAIASHYTKADLKDAILAGLRNAGKDLNNLGPQDLAVTDEFHIRGREGTIELAKQLDLDVSKIDLDTRIFSPRSVPRLSVTIGRYRYLFKRLTAVAGLILTDLNR
jgi:hypothetical protein